MQLNYFFDLEANQNRILCVYLSKKIKVRKCMIFLKSTTIPKYFKA